MSPDRLAVDRPRGEAAAGIPGIAAELRGVLARSVTKIAVEAAVPAQRLEQDLLVLLGHRLVERPFAGRLGQELGDRPLEIGLHLADSLRPAVERLGRMKTAHCD